MRIVLYPTIAGKPFNGSTIYGEALGGSESAIVYMARELAKLGHEVIVFARGHGGLYDDVIYMPYQAARTFLLTNPVDVLVAARDATPLTWQHQASITLYWGHDIPQQAMPEASMYVFVSNWQATLYANLAPQHRERIKVSPNGIDTSLFQKAADIRPLTPEDTPRLVWTSNPERGLWYAGKVLQEVRKTFPKAELHVLGRNSVYGWNNSYEHVFYPDSMDGVVVHYPMPKDQLALFLADMDVFIYPTWWPETFCIATLEAQAAGLPVVASGYAALTETVQAGMLINGRAGTEEHDRQFPDIVVDVLNDVETRKLMAERGRGFAHQFNWATHAKRWSDLLTNSIGLTA